VISVTLYKIDIMLETYHIRIKKEYANDVIKDLEKMEALEVLPDSGVPEWHMSIVSERLEEYKRNPSLATDFDKTMDDVEKEL
jgi:hypothetical protein